MSINLIQQLLGIWLIILILLTVRGITPRYKTDVLITIIWKILLPVTLCDLLILTLYIS